MKAPPLFADECCPARLVRALRDLGFDVAYVIEGGVGLSDVEQAREAFRQGRVLVSADYDFGELAIRHAEPFTGLVLLAASLELELTGSAAVIAARVDALAHGLTGKLTVIEKDQVRQRAL